MKNPDIHLVTIGYARQALVAESREYTRFKTYADAIGSLSVIVFTNRNDGYSEPLQDGNLTIYPTNSRTRIGMIIDAITIGRHIIKSAPERSWIVSSQDPFETSLVGKLVVWGTKAVHHVQLHGDNFSDTGWRSESLMNRVRYYFGLFILHRVHRIRVASLRIKRSLLLQGIPEERITVLPIRPEIERFLRVSHIVGPHNPFVFLVASRFSYEKNIPLIIRAFAQIAKEYSQVKLRIVGKGGEESTIRACIEEYSLGDRVEIISWSEEIELEMQRADVFLLASNHEAYGLTLVETMAVGLPIITTDVGCVGELLVPNEHAVVVPVGDEVAYADAMRRLILDETLRKNLSYKGKMRATELAKQTPEEYAEAWVAAFS